MFIIRGESQAKLQFYFIRIKKGEGQGKEKCDAKSMMSNGVNESLKIYTQHVS